MAVENETAEQVVKMVLEGTEVVLRLSGEAAINAAKLIYAALKGDHTKKGRATLWEFIKSGKDQKLFQIPDEYLKAFTTASKKYGFPFVVLKDKNNKNGKTDIMVYAADSSKVNRVIESLNLNVNKAEIVKPEVKLVGSDEYIKPLNMKLKVPFELIDNIPPEPSSDKRLMAELQKYAAKMRASGPQIVEPVGLLCKENGHYELLPGEGAKRLMALRLAGYRDAVAEISVPKSAQVEVRAENIDERQPQDRKETPKSKDAIAPTENAKDEPMKEEGQTINPTMARTNKDQAFGQGLERSSGKKGETVLMGKKPSVRKELERCKTVADGQNAIREAQRATRRMIKGVKK